MAVREDPDEEKGIAEETMSEAEASGQTGRVYLRSYPLVTHTGNYMLNQLFILYMFISLSM